MAKEWLMLQGGVLAAFAEAFTGTKSIPHFGHLPGSSEIMSGCMGQKYFCAGLAAAAAGVSGFDITGIKVMPHSGHLPGLSWWTLACSGIGHV
jgi:hypothetical protein